MFVTLATLVIKVNIAGNVRKATGVLVPLLNLVLFVVINCGIVGNNFNRTITCLFAPSLDGLATSIVLTTLNRTFFALSVNVNVVITCNSCLNHRMGLLGATQAIIVLSAIVTLTTNLTVFPVVFDRNLSPTSNPNLVFIDLPVTFNDVNTNAVLKALFFLLVAFTTVASSISLLRPAIRFLRRQASVGHVVTAIITDAIV